MTVYLCRTYVVKAGKLKEHNEWGKRLVALMKTKPALFDGAKSLQVLSYKCSGEARKFTAMWGFDSSVDLEGWERGFCEIPEEMALRTEFLKLVAPDSVSVSIVETIKSMHKTRHPTKK